MDRQTTHGGSAGALWPFGPLAALLSVPGIWLIVALVLWAAHRWFDWPTASAGGGVVYIAVAVGLVPIVLLILEAAARQRGVLSTRWVSIDFGRIDEPRARPVVKLETSLGFEGQPITDSSVATIHETVNAAGTNRIVCIDIGVGGNWWMTRLFALCVGASRQSAPEIIVFVGSGPAGRPEFLGWVRSRDALRLLLGQRPVLRAAYDHSLAIGRYLTTAAPSVESATPVVGADSYWLRPQFQGLGEETGLRVLLDLLGTYEQHQVPVGGERVTSGVLHDLLGVDLCRQQLDLRWSDQHQLEEFLAMTEEYVAIVAAGRFERLAHRSILESALLRQILLPSEQP